MTTSAGMRGDGGRCGERGCGHDRPARIGPLEAPVPGASRVVWWRGEKQGADDEPNVELPPELAADSPAEGATPPAEVIELATEREGWTASAWRDYLLKRADECDSSHPSRAAELRHAAVLMMPDLRARSEERAAIQAVEAEVEGADAK